MSAPPRRLARHLRPLRDRCGPGALRCDRRQVARWAGASTRRLQQRASQPQPRIVLPSLHRRVGPDDADAARRLVVVADRPARSSDGQPDDDGGGGAGRRGVAWRARLLRGPAFPSDIPYICHPPARRRRRRCGGAGPARLRPAGFWIERQQSARPGRAGGCCNVRVIDMTTTGPNTRGTQGRSFAQQSERTGICGPKVRLLSDHARFLSSALVGFSTGFDYSLRRRRFSDQWG